MNKSSKILLIEDEVITAMSLIMDLKKNGYIDSKFVSTGAKAVASVMEQMPDLIIADVSLSGGESGIDVAGEISGSSGIPIIVTSGYEVEELSSRMNILNNAHFIRKPVNISLLIKLIKSL
ncbi:MAG: response regulator [Spirochaetales bacterium]|nr:response regulator [Spirochaetales bacterium]